MLEVVLEELQVVPHLLLVVLEEVETVVLLEAPLVRMLPITEVAVVVRQVAEIVLGVRVIKVAL